MPQPPIGLRLTMDIHEGQEAALEKTIAELIEQVEATEPGTKSYEFFLSSDHKHLTAFDWYEDEEAAIAHLTGEPVGTYLPKLLELADVERLEVYGNPGEALSKVLENFPVSEVNEHIGGFER